MSNKKEQEFELYKRYQQGEQEAKKELLNSLDPLINQQVRKFYNSGLPNPAVKLQGYALASHAIDTYDPNKAQLNTHVVNNLKKLSRFVTDYQNVGHIPEPRALMIGKYKTIYSNLETELGREPTNQEMVEAMKVGPKEIERLQIELRGDLSTGLIEQGDEDDTGFYEFKKQKEMDPKVQQAIDFIYFDSDPIDKKILEYTLGLFGNPMKNNKQIQQVLKLKPNELRKRKINLAKQIKGLS